MKRVLNLKKEQDMYFAGGLLSENFTRKLSLALYQEMTNLGM